MTYDNSFAGSIVDYHLEFESVDDENIRASVRHNGGTIIDFIEESEETATRRACKEIWDHHFDNYNGKQWRLYYSWKLPDVDPFPLN